ncbi:MAG TPA: glycosyltransferase [Edaphocola sp.]|nr:glycosyltransferase [Edaphocola sp.]
MKIKLLFVNESLTLAGGEKSLIALLSNLDPEKYEIDLQLFHYGGELDSFIPSYVNILPPLPYTSFANQGLYKSITNCYKKNHLKFLIAKLTYSLRLRTGQFSHPEKAQLYWESVHKSFSKPKKVYDVAIAYAQGIPTFYVNEKINALKKVAWINVNVKFSEKNKVFQENHYRKFDSIIAVSEFTHEHLKNLFPLLQNKYDTIYDIIDYQSIVKMSQEAIECYNKDSFNILTVARLNKAQKGYDIVLEVCKILKEKNINFHWYAIGIGPYKTEMESYIKENQLEAYFTFLGTKKNPYPYFKNADLYVQTSRHEGFGLSIGEARLLNTPVVTTRFDTVFMQMVDGKNGLVTDINATAVADAIEKMMNDKNLYDSIVAYLKQEQKENKESAKKFDSLIEELLSK